MFIIDYITANYILLIEIAGLWVMSFISVHLSKRTVYYTRIVTVLLLLDSVLYNVEAWTQTFEEYTVLRPILTACVYTLQPVIMIFLMQITVPLKKKNYWLLLPGVVSAVLFFTSQWTKLICFFSEENHYHGGPLGWFPYFIFGFYVLIFIIQCIRYLRYYQLKEKVAVLYIILAPITGVTVYYLMNYSGDYSTLFTSAILMYYLFLYIHMARIDPLTGLMNRECFYRDIASAGKRLSAVVSADMNELKWINDSEGHAAGDKAIKTVALCLAENSGIQKHAYRIGGDEFVILYTGMSRESVISDVEAMRSGIAETPYVCAFGYSFTDGDVNADKVLKEADKAMYADKARLKREVLEKGGTLHRRKDD